MNLMKCDQHNPSSDDDVAYLALWRKSEFSSINHLQYHTDITIDPTAAETDMWTHCVSDLLLDKPLVGFVLPVW